jgi:hypothetical protein
LRNCADLAIDLPAANPRRRSVGDFAFAMPRLRVFATAPACWREIGRDPELGFDKRDPRRRDYRVPPALGAPAVSG